MAKKPLTAVTPSSGNVFADIRVPEPDEELASSARMRTSVRSRASSSRSADVSPVLP